ncbi:MAG: adenosine kinase [Cyanobacteria bacterium P01_H01_bin.15]
MGKKKYDVYGIGNALLDMEYEVTPQLLTELGIDKGVMTLMDEQQQAQIVEKLSHLPCKRSCGGSAANTIVAIAQLEGKAGYACKVAKDEPGTFYLEDLQHNGVDIHVDLDQRETGITGKCLVLVTPDADRTMNTFLGITADLSEAEMSFPDIQNSEYLYIEGYLASSEIALKSAIKAKEIAQNSGVKIAFTLSDFNMVAYFKPGLEAIIGSGVDLLFANESEAFKLAETENLAEAITYFKTLSQTFAITRGPEGSILWDGSKLIEIEPVRVQAVDTVGAGDMYAGALLYGVTKGWDWEKAGKLAAQSSAELVTSLGARLETTRLRALRDGGLAA